MAKVTRPSALILKNKRTGEFLLMHLAIQPSVGWKIGWGRPVSYTADEFCRSGLAALLTSFGDFFARDGDDESKALRIPADEQAKFTRDHLSLGVRAESPTLLVFTPTNREDGGHVGDGEHIQLSLPCTPTEFYRTVEAAFEQCS